MSQATLDTPPASGDAGPEAASVPSCAKCGFATAAAACPRCGWYASLGIHVEIDPAYEALMAAPGEATGDADEPLPAPPAWRKHLDVWAGLIPWWGWVLLGTTLGCVAAAIAVRLTVAASPTAHAWCGVGGLVAGLMAAFAAHFVAFILCSAHDATFGAVDLVVRPLKSWKRVLGELPERLWLANTANFGLSLAVSSTAIIGGIPYEKLLDWGFKAPPKASLVGAIVDAAKQAPEDDKSMEEAMGEFAEGAGADDLDSKPAEPAKPPREKLECLIIGYQGDKAGRIDALLLASEAGGKLRYVGRVRPALTPKEQADLRKKFSKHISTRPFVKTSDSGNWLRPRFTCSVTYTKWPEGGRPQEVEWGALLNEVSLPW